MVIDEKIDTGRIILREAIRIQPGETAGELHDRLMIKGADHVVRTVKAIEAGDVPALPQEELQAVSGPLKPAPKIQKEDCRINWDQNARGVFNFIHGMSPNPGAFTELNVVDGSSFYLKVFRAQVEVVLADSLIQERTQPVPAREPQRR